MHKNGGPRVGRAKQLATAILLPTDRPLPIARHKELATPNTASAEEYFKNSFKNRKSANTPPMPVVHYSLSAAACPRLAAKFARAHPHLFVQPNEDDDIMTRPLNSESGVREPLASSHTVVCDLLDNGSGSSGTMLPLREGSVRTESKAPPDPHSGRGECQEKN